MTLEEFKRCLGKHLEQIRQAESNRDHIVGQMVDLQPRLTGFEQLATCLIADIIRPRLGVLASNFSNADLDRQVQSHACAASFGYCQRFPASARIEFSIEHDDHVEKLVVRCEVRIQPVFLKYEPHDKLVLLIHECDEDQITSWVEQKIISFLTDYERLDRGDETLDVDLVTDPVCGMRLMRSTATGQECYLGHPYFFCAEECREKFMKEPTRYVWFRT
jgi:YHS domain-containing protein